MKYYNIDKEIIAFSTERGCQDATKPFDGFNITYYTNDNPQHIFNCKQALCNDLGIDDQHLVLPRQVHDIKVAEVTEQNICSKFEGFDSLITTLPRTCIGVSTADCVPILIYDTRARAIAAAHAGWRGTVGRIGRKTVLALQNRYESRPEDMMVIIGPSIGPDAFEVGDEVYDAFRKQYFAMNKISFKIREKWHIDLWQANMLDLVESGVKLSNINIVGICTYQNYERFFSARRLGINSGRIFTGIMKKR